MRLSSSITFPSKGPDAHLSTCVTASQRNRTVSWGGAGVCQTPYRNASRVLSRMRVESSHECAGLWSRGLLRSTARLYEDLLVVIRMFKCSNKEVGVVCARMTSEVGRKVGGELRNANAFVAVNEGWHGELRLKRASPLYCGGKGVLW